jgi:hypothetical protein
LLRVSHLLIRHSTSNNGRVSFAAVDWRSVTAPPTRTRVQALALASKIRRQITDGTISFSDAARRWSEDITTRELGGSMGVVMASQFQAWPQGKRSGASQVVHIAP